VGWEDVRVSGTESEASVSEIRRTPLYDRHLAAGARLIPFAGWEMPVQYAGILQEHHAVRNNAGLFDLGHMGQVTVAGPDALAFLQTVTTNDVSVLGPGQAQYSLLPNEQGGVIDDIIVYRQHDGDGFFVVVNASTREKDVAWLQAQRASRLDLDVTLADVSDQTGMIAIQGPKANDIVQSITDVDLAPVTAFSWTSAIVAGIPLMIARTGYTGEDGFEFFPKIADVGPLWDALVDTGRSAGVSPIGLGARDTLRLEARMPLYGNEMDDTISPLEAGLGWAVKLDKGDFIGRDAINTMKVHGAPRRTVGFKMTARSGAPRSHYPVHVDGKNVGWVTSGALSPTLGENIGLALIERDCAGIGNPLDIEIRGKNVPAVQVKTPFYKRDRSTS